MPNKPTGLATYTDVQEVADLVLKHRGGDYECPHHNAAIHFTHRFYKFRQLYRKVHGEPCKYDVIMCKRVAPDDPVVRFRIRQHVGTFTPLGPSVVDTTELNEDLFDLANQLAKKLGESK